ncbi:MAG: transketolase C-terminal domain-containing protein, partial [Sulfurovum sp.]
FAKAYRHPCAFRYPRGAFLAADSSCEPYELGKSVMLQEGEDALFIGYGNGVGRAMLTAELMEQKVGILDLRFVKPLDIKMLLKLSADYKKWYVFSDSAAKGGVGSALLELLSEEGMADVSLTTFEYDDAFITHGETTLVEESLGLLPEQLAARIYKDLREDN